MNIKQIKHKLLEWKDFYGQDIVDTETIKKAGAKKTLKKVLKNHIRWLQDQNLDAIHHAEKFMRGLFK